MNVSNPQNEIYDAILSLGWEITGKISFKNGQYIVRGTNSTTGQEVDRSGDTPEMAIAALYQYAQRANQIRAYASLEKLSVWDGGDWLAQKDDIAKAYSKLPPFDQKAVSAWQALGVESKLHADAIRNNLKVQVTNEPEPYESFQDMKDDVHKKQKYVVSRHNIHHPVWPEQTAIDHRISHDILGHANGGSDWSWPGEVRAAGHHLPLLSPLAREAEFVESLAPQAYRSYYHGHGPQKIGLMSEFLHPVQEKEGEHVQVPSVLQPPPQQPQVITQQPAYWPTTPSPVMQGYQLQSSTKERNASTTSTETELEQEGNAEYHKQTRGHSKKAENAVATDYKWPTPDDIFALSEMGVENHQGYRDPEGLVGAAGNVQMKHGYGMYNNPFEVAADLIYKIQRQQAVVDGNKRTALLTGLHFLEENGYDTTNVSRLPAQENQLFQLVMDLTAPGGENYTIPALAEFLQQNSIPYTQEITSSVYDWERVEEDWLVAI